MTFDECRTCGTLNVEKLLDGRCLLCHVASRHTFEEFREAKLNVLREDQR